MHLRSVHTVPDCVTVYMNEGDNRFCSCQSIGANLIIAPPALVMGMASHIANDSTSGYGRAP